MTQEQESPTRVGEPYKIDTVEEPCQGCGVVQEMDVYRQEMEYNDDIREWDNTRGECPVCGNDHAANPPW